MRVAIAQGDDLNHSFGGSLKWVGLPKVRPLSVIDARILSTKKAAATRMGERLLRFKQEVLDTMLEAWTNDELQQLHQAVTLVDYHSLFSYYGFRFGTMNGGCWLVAKAIQAVAGGELYYLALNVGCSRVGAFIHAVVKLGEDTFMDGHGLHTAEQLLAAWSHYENTKHAHLEVLPLFLLPDHLERNATVIEAIAYTIEQQNLLLAEAEMAKQAEQRLAQATNADDDTGEDETALMITACSWAEVEEHFRGRGRHWNP
jgi:hypothetical protein